MGAEPSMIAVRSSSVRRAGSSEKPVTVRFTGEMTDSYWGESVLSAKEKRPCLRVRVAMSRALRPSDGSSFFGWGLAGFFAAGVMRSRVVLPWASIRNEPRGSITSICPILRARGENCRVNFCTPKDLKPPISALDRPSVTRKASACREPEIWSLSPMRHSSLPPRLPEGMSTSAASAT